MVEAPEDQSSEKKTETPASAEAAESSVPTLPDDFYERLGISENATPEEIDAAYSEKAKEFQNLHPDRNGGSKESNEFFAKLSEAKLNLKDPISRKKYNEERRQRQEKERAAADEKNSEREQARARGTSQARREAEEAYKSKESDNEGVQGSANRDETVYDPSIIKEKRHGRVAKIDGYEVFVDKDGRPINPFWKSQESKRSSFDHFIDKTVERMQDGYETVKKSIHPFRLNENPVRSRRTLERYEEMVRAGQAEFVGEQETVNIKARGNWQGSPSEKNRNSPPWKISPNFEHYREIEKAYRKRGGFDGFKYEVVEIYNEQNRFTGKYRIYRIKT